MLPYMCASLRNTPLLQHVQQVRPIHTYVLCRYDYFVLVIITWAAANVLDVHQPGPNIHN